MRSNPVRETDIKNASSQSSLDQKEIEAALNRVQKVAQENLTEYFSWAWLEFWQNRAVIISNHHHEHCIFALTDTDLRDLIDEANVSDAEFKAIEDAYYSYAMYRVQKGFDPDESEVTQWAGNLLVVERPDGWGQARLATSWEFMSLASAGLSAAEALDYWIVERQEMPLDEWAQNRGVGKEAIRKNIRQASTKL